VAYDDDLTNGIKNLEEILYKLDERAKDAAWMKEHARRQAEESARPVEPRRLKVYCRKCGKELPMGEAVAGEAPKCPDCDTPELVRTFAETEPAKGPEPAAAGPAVEPEPYTKAAREIPVTASAPEKVTEAAITPDPVKAPEPAVKAAEPAIKVPGPEVKPPEVIIPPAPEPVKAPEQPAPPVSAPEKTAKEIPPAPVAPKQGVKPAKKIFVPNKKLLLLFCVGLAVVYQFTFNSARHRYAQAGKLASTARNSEAISAYTKIITQYPGSLEAAYSQFAIGEIKAVQGDPAGAIAHYEQFLLAARDKDSKIPEAKFRIAEIEFKQNNFLDAAFMYNNADIQASGYAARAAQRLAQIKAVNTQIADAKKLAARDPGKAVEAYSAVLAAYPGYAPAAAGLEEAQKAVADAKEHPLLKPRRAGRTTRAAASRGHKAGSGKAAGAALYSKESFNSCNSIWMAEKVIGHLEGDMLAEKTKYNCDALKEDLAACKDLQIQYKAIQTLKPEARALMEQGINQNWTVQDQVAQDKKTLKAYAAHHCGEFTKTVPN
jgi:TolA-binding protein